MNFLTRLAFTLFILAAATGALAQEPAAEEPTRFQRAFLLYQQGADRAEEVLALLRDEVAENPEHADAWLLMATTQFGVGDYEAAVPSFEAAEKHGAADARSAILHAEALFRVKRYSDAAKYLSDKEALLAASEQTKAGAERLAQMVTVGQRTGYLNEAFEIFVQQGLSPEAQYVYLVADPGNVDVVREDKELGAFLKPGQSGDWATVLAVPREENNPKVFAIYYVDGAAQAWLLLTKSPDPAIARRQLNPAYLQTLLKQLHAWQVPAEPTQRLWSVFPVLNSEDRELQAFSLAPDAVSAP